ncbi:1-phosphatidylinositol 4,5-bisphosphate phosphodiesterase eta-2 [Liparis tanakae]|uniref:1-phosphatidylinositol 4,5-bisphosphate phosphodiesterase eta-2 n=1 Tax=Liparis tanakae TaxID=230148 RepID=A0A4Z2G312_9TELE|nr:1-phosphatidylinositol 4,5-bisphosphate phosphodiesterase eta-2 [Liparis tanakae]
MEPGTLWFRDHHYKLQPTLKDVGVPLSSRNSNRSYPVILSIENHCSVPQQKKMAQYLTEILGDKLDVSNIKVDESGWLPSPAMLKGKILVKGKKLPSSIDENAEEGDVSDEDSADEMDDDCKLMNGDVCTLFGPFLSFRLCAVVGQMKSPRVSLDPSASSVVPRGFVTSFSLQPAGSGVM